MLRWSLRSFALLVLAMGLLTVVRSPDWSQWRLAVLAGEYGYALAFVPLGLAALAWSTRGSNPLPAIATRS